MTPSALREARLRLGLSQARLAALLPTSKRNVENWEQGHREPPTYLWRVLRDLGRELDGE